MRRADSLVCALCCALVCALGSAGCSTGFGSAYVGQWRPRNPVAFEACIEDDQGRCLEQKRVHKPVAGRTFWGTAFSLGVGASKVKHAGESRTRTRTEPSMEVLWGFGRTAWGVRGSTVIDTYSSSSDMQGAAATDYSTSMLALTGLGYLSLSDQVGVRAGLGALPYSRLGKTDETSYLGARGLLGLQLALLRTTADRFLVLTIEADTVLVRAEQTYRSSGLTFHLGFLF